MVEALILIVFSITAIEKSGGFIIRPNGFVIRLLMLQYERQPSCPLSYGLTDSSHVAFDWRVFFRCVPPFGWLRKGIHRDSRRRNSDACTAHTDIFTWRMKITGNTISTPPVADNYEVPDSVMYSPFSYSRRPSTSQISSGNAASKPSCGTLLRQHCVQCSFYLTNLYGRWLF